MSKQHFKNEYAPLPRRGFTSVEAAEYLKQEFPQIPCWTFYTPPNSTTREALTKFIGKGYQPAGTLGAWQWTRTESSYPHLAYWDGRNTPADEGDDWLGVLEITAPSHEKFMIFSFLNSTGMVGTCYMLSTLNVELIARFTDDLVAHYQCKDCFTIHVPNGRDIQLPLRGTERIFMPETLRQEIETQVYSFFRNSKAYEKLNLRHRRGMLFVGSPGNGKTMLLRQLARRCYTEYQANPILLAIGSGTDDDEVRWAFRTAARRAPALVILEDLDSLAHQCSKVSRSTLLNELDGLDAKSGILVIGTTNHPEQIDPALVHRPSRFDRVWHFPLPDFKMRLHYLREIFPGINSEQIQGIAKETDNWSFAYLNELRTTAAIFCMDRQTDCLLEQDLAAAHQQLAAQFQAGQKNHIISEGGSTLGFKAA